MRGTGTRRRRLARTLPVLLLAALVAVALALGRGADRGPAGGGPGPGGPDGPAAWAADLSRVDGDDVNVVYADGALRLWSPEAAPGLAGEPGYGAQVAADHLLDRPVTRVRAVLDADVLAGAGAEADVRGRDASGAWGEWRRADTARGAALPRPAVAVQSRLTLRDDGAGVRVRGLRLTADASAPAAQPAAAAAFDARVFATREGLKGRTTANGHVITADDHFVALPSERALSRKGGHEYAVRVCGPARCETAPVWDTGPWNIRDDYWNGPAVRESFTDLPHGRPEAQAAFEDGCNRGRDASGRTVRTPAGIDLADGTFARVGLEDNGWVTVTYLGTGGTASAKPGE